MSWTNPCWSSSRRSLIIRDGEDDDQAVGWSASKRTLIRDGEDDNQAVGGRCNKRCWCDS
eukprot:scaffold3692_cov73-Cylindrotheca_fusiformis.AAC.1